MRFERKKTRSLCGSLNGRRDGPTRKHLHKLSSWPMKALIDHKVPAEVKVVRFATIEDSTFGSRKSLA